MLSKPIYCCMECIKDSEAYKQFKRVSANSVPSVEELEKLGVFTNVFYASQECLDQHLYRNHLLRR